METSSKLRWFYVLSYRYIGLQTPRNIISPILAMDPVSYTRPDYLYQMVVICNVLCQQK